MIIGEYIRIPTKGCRKIKSFEKLGYDINGEFIDLKFNDLNIGSRQIVSVECDFCLKIVSIAYREYLRNISIGGKYACSKLCGSEKAKFSNLEKWGVEYPMMLDEIQKKTKQTNFERYGVEFLQQSELFRLKSKKTNLEKYGVEKYSKTVEFLEKFKKTNFSRYSVEFPFQSVDIREKAKNTWLENYGFDNPSKFKEVREKAKNTNLERYGVEIPIKLKEFKEKTIQTNMNRYGVDNTMKSDYLRKYRYSITSDERYIKYIDSSKSLMLCDKGHEFIIHVDNYIERLDSNLPICTVCYPIGEKCSIKESELYNFIRYFYKGEIIKSYRDGLEIDIYLPEMKIGFEFNGLYWHSDKYKEKNYHQKKTAYFLQRGIRIIHIWEDDWVFKNKIIKSQIINWLSLSSCKIFARKCCIQEICVKESREFLNNNHIQGYVNSVVRIGLYIDGELVSIMTFDHLEGRKKMDETSWNLSRFCNKLNTNVIGGASKLLTYFINKNSPSRIISYADRDWSQGLLYYKLGFENIKESKVDYKYIVDGKRVHKSRYTKNKLLTSLSETKEMSNKGILRIWDCGKIKFELFNTKFL